MKGKEALKSARRRETEASEARLELKAALINAENRIVTLQRQLADQRGLLAEIERLRAQTKSRTSDVVERQRLLIESLQDELRKKTDRLANIQKHWDRLIRRNIRRLGGGLDGIEEFGKLLGDDFRIVENDYQKKLDPEAVKRIQVKRGLRAKT